MQQPEATESIMETPAGSRLGIEESAAIEDALTFMLDEASQDRDGEEHPVPRGAADIHEQYNAAGGNGGHV